MNLTQLTDRGAKAQNAISDLIEGIEDLELPIKHDERGYYIDVEEADPGLFFTTEQDAKNASTLLKPAMNAVLIGSILNELTESLNV